MREDIRNKAWKVVIARKYNLRDTSLDRAFLVGSSGWFVATWFCRRGSRSDILRFISFRVFWLPYKSFEIWPIQFLLVEWEMRGNCKSNGVGSIPAISFFRIAILLESCLIFLFFTLFLYNFDAITLWSHPRTTSNAIFNFPSYLSNQLGILCSFKFSLFGKKCIFWTVYENRATIGNSLFQILATFCNFSVTSVYYAGNYRAR